MGEGKNEWEAGGIFGGLMLGAQFVGFLDMKSLGAQGWVWGLARCRYPFCTQYHVG